VVLTGVLAGALRPADAQGRFLLIPSLSLTEEYDSNIRSESSGEDSDFITRITPQIALLYESTSFSVLGSYALGSAIYAEHSDLNEVADRHQAALQLSWLPSPRVTTGLGVFFSRSESAGTTFPASPLSPPPAVPPAESGGPPAPGPAAPSSVTPPGAPAGPEAPPAPAGPPPATLVGLPTVETGRQTTTQVVVSPTVSYVLDAATVARGTYSYSRAEVEDLPTNESHQLDLSLARDLTARDQGILTYRLGVFTEGEDDGGGDPGWTTAHALTLGWVRQLTDRTAIRLEAGPRYSEGDVDAELGAALWHRFRGGTASVSYERTQSVVVGREGAQTVDVLSAAVVWEPRRAVQVGVAPSVSRFSGEESEDVLLYAVTAEVGYLFRPGVRFRATYRFSYQEDGASITHHIVSVGVDISHAFLVGR
jgi:hypothetical protein